MMKTLILTVLFCLGINTVFASDQTGIPDCDRFIQYSEELLSLVNQPDLTEKAEAGLESLKKDILNSKTAKQKKEIEQTCTKAFTLLSDAVNK